MTNDFAPNVRKCPRHNCWIQSRDEFHPVRHRQRYCPRCDLERLQAAMLAEAEHQEATGLSKPKLIIRKI
jgi:hypothetical protein